MKKCINLFASVVLVVLSVSTFAETWVVTDSFGDEMQWIKETGSIPTEFFAFMCTKGCESYGDGYLYTTSDNHTTGDFETSTSSSHLCHWIFVGEKYNNGDDAKGDLVRTCINNVGVYDCADGTWSALISEGNGKKLLARKLTEQETDKLQANKDNN